MRDLVGDLAVKETDQAIIASVRSVCRANPTLGARSIAARLSTPARPITRRQVRDAMRAIDDAQTARMDERRLREDARSRVLSALESRDFDEVARLLGNRSA